MNVINFCALLKSYVYLFNYLSLLYTLFVFFCLREANIIFRLWRHILHRQAKHLSFFGVPIAIKTSYLPNLLLSLNYYFP